MPEIVRADGSVITINTVTGYAEYVNDPESRVHLPHFYWSDDWKAWRAYLLEHKLYGKYKGKPHEQRMIERMRGKYNDIRFVVKCATKYEDEYAVFIATRRIRNARRRDQDTDNSVDSASF